MVACVLHTIHMSWILLISDESQGHLEHLVASVLHLHVRIPGISPMERMVACVPHVHASHLFRSADPRDAHVQYTCSHLLQMPQGGAAGACDVQLQDACDHQHLVGCFVD